MRKLTIEGTTTAIVKVDDRCIRWDALLTEIILCFACDQAEELPLQLEREEAGRIVHDHDLVHRAGEVFDRKGDKYYTIYLHNEASIE